MRWLLRIVRTLLEIEGAVSIWQWIAGGGVSTISAIIAYFRDAPIWQIVLIWLAIFLVFIVVTTYLSDYFKQKRGLDSRILPLHRINLILQKMEQRSLKLVQKEKNKEFDVERWIETNREINTEMLGLGPSKAKTVGGARRVASRWESSIREWYTTEGGDMQQGLNTLVKISMLLDGRGFGLKEQRERDKKYPKLSNQLDEIRNLPMVITELNNLIKRHIVYAEMIANMLLAICRSMRLKTKVKDAEYSVTDFFSIPMEADIEGFERSAKEFLRGIRAEINECIRELGKGKDDG